MTRPPNTAAEDAWATLQAVRTECEIRVRRADHRPLTATLCYDPRETSKPYFFGFPNSRSSVDELPFLMLCGRAVPAAKTLGMGGELPEYLSVAGQWCLVVTRVMPLPHPLHHGVWVGSKEIDPNEEVFDEFPDVFSITAQAIGFMMAMKQPPVSPEGRAIDAPQADSARTPLIPQPLAPMTDLQQAIWDALEGKAMTEKELRKLLEPGSEVRPAIARIKAGGRRIENRRGAGYFRPDAPPPDRG